MSLPLFEHLVVYDYRNPSTLAIVLRSDEMGSFFYRVALDIAHSVQDLDIDAIEFLENWLSRARCTLLMVTHDRYFLDNVCNTIMELDHGKLYIYKGDYRNYLEKRSERIENYNAETDKVRNILRRELEWMRSTPQARTGKAKYRIDAFHDLKDRASRVYTEKTVSLREVKGSARLGTKIINCKDVSFHYGDKCYLDHFTYNFQRYERIGIVGRNGAGKSTFINLMTGD